MQKARFLLIQAFATLETIRKNVAEHAPELTEANRGVAYRDPEAECKQLVYSFDLSQTSGTWPPIEHVKNALKKVAHTIYLLDDAGNWEEKAHNSPSVTQEQTLNKFGSLNDSARDLLELLLDGPIDREFDGRPFRTVKILAQVGLVTYKEHWTTGDDGKPHRIVHVESLWERRFPPVPGYDDVPKPPGQKRHTPMADLKRRTDI